MIQDLIISIGQIIFIVALLPTIFNKDKPPIKTSLPTGIILIIIAINFLSLTLYYSFITSGINGIEWLILTYQKYKSKK
jgi:threonine/homoserine/homoserine lactone efflux protein